MNTVTEEPTMQSINPILEAGNNWLNTAIQHAGPEEFKAFVSSPRGSYCLGVFKTMQEANEAISEADQARWNG